MGNGIDYKQLTSPCGLDCFNCPMYLAGQNKKMRSAIAKNMDIPFEIAVCSGCRNEKGIISFLRMSEPCNVYKCITKKGLLFCSDCLDFPCDYLHPYANQALDKPHNMKVFNLNLIKKMGLESWAKNKAKDVREVYFKGKFKI